MDINMKVQPSFFDEECAIVFSFYFDQEAKKIGEAVIYTCEEEDCLKKDCQADSKELKEKVAYVEQFSIVKEYQSASMEKITQFLNILGIKKCRQRRIEEVLN
ncbi:hypothetical protein SAMN05443252_102291 [Bacillus sp. OV322]|uniref:hypothetical protein n=1 Tax=Bacillus sp. OV322 TaxID=1882764 RepID=UPI0008F3B326|nr:hypothetical protein [Bacillus sp. OV322]SFC22818.1 hypothetical protein SAMN05443252_102291 [Bacillus sp. OV322]